MGKEETYEAQLKELGIWNEAFKAEVKTLSQLERDETRARKAWSASAPPGGKPSLLDPHYAVIMSLRREILAHRETLGLTPKALRRLRGREPVSGPSQQDLLTEKLTAIAERVGAYEGAVEAETKE